MPARRRVMVTGLGQHSALGAGIPVFWEAVRRGHSGVRRLPHLRSTSVADPIGAAVWDWTPERHFSPKKLVNLARATQLAVVAGREAFFDAGLETAQTPDAAIFVGTGFGGLEATEEAYRRCHQNPNQRPRPGTIPTGMANAAAAWLASELELRGINLTIATACSSGTHAIGQAFRLLRSGEVEIALAGGTDAPLAPLLLAAWAAMRVLAPAADDPARACRPFSPDRAGLVVGEGAAFLVLETLEHARARGARLLGEIVGYGANADAGHLTHPDAESVCRCLELALADAELDPEAVGYVNAHGTGTLVNDRVEAEALARVFGDHAPRLAVSSIKAITGHAMGASGALEALATVLTLLEQTVAPTAHLVAPDPELPPLDFVHGAPRAQQLDTALTSSLAFGGNNAVLALRRPVV